MRKINCISCSFSCNEADKEWDTVVTTQKCPKCYASIQNPELRAAAASVIDVSFSQQQLPSNKPFIHNGVVVTDVQMPFESMVIFMVKWVLASIPAFIILILFFFLVSAVTGTGFNLFKSYI